MQIVTTHINTDFDALASVIAATLLYPGAIPILPKNLNPNVKAFLSLHKDLLQVSAVNDINLEDVGQMIVVDVNTWERLDRMGSLKSKGDLEIHLWDHHTNAGNITAKFNCREPVGATVTLLTRQLKKEGKLLSPIQATLLLAGIYEDTGNLTFPSTTAADAYAAAYLLERKADLKIKESQLKSPVKAFMTTKILTIEPGKSPMEAARLMVKHDIGRLPVVENNRIIGIITRSDAMLYFYDLLPD